MNPYYYVTCMTQKNFIKEYGRYALISLLKCGIKPEDIHVCVLEHHDVDVIRRYIEEPVKIHICPIDLSHVKWTYEGGKRKYSLFKIHALNVAFPRPIKDRRMVYFDGDVLWFKDPKEFFMKWWDCTWFHHGKDYSIKAMKKFGITEKDVNVNDYKSFSKWVPAPTAHLLMKYGMSHFPKRECVAGLYVLHPRDHEILLRTTYVFTEEISHMDVFTQHWGAGDQKPMNAALNRLNIYWCGGSRFECPEHKEFFFHYFGDQEQKKAFHRKVKEMNLQFLHA